MATKEETAFAKRTLLNEAMKRLAQAKQDLDNVRRFAAQQLKPSDPPEVIERAAEAESRASIRFESAAVMALAAYGTSLEVDEGRHD